MARISAYLISTPWVARANVHSGGSTLTIVGGQRALRDAVTSDRHFDCRKRRPHHLVRLVGPNDDRIARMLIPGSPLISACGRLPITAHFIDPASGCGATRQRWGGS